MTASPRTVPLRLTKMLAKPGPRVGAQEVEIRRLLQLALDLVDHLLLHLLDGRAGPQHLHDHDAEGEVGVLLLADAQEREAACRQQQHEQEGGEVAVRDRPARQVEAPSIGSGLGSGMRGWPGFRRRTWDMLRYA